MSCHKGLLLFLSCILASSSAIQAERASNANATYQQLRTLLPGREEVTVHELVIHREAATLTLHDGVVNLYGAVNGKWTGGVFKGHGHLHMEPPSAAEKHNLKILTHNMAFDEDFEEAVLRFTDNTAEELRAAATAKGEASSPLHKPAEDLQSYVRHHWSENLDLRLLQDVLSPAPGGYFLANIHGTTNSRLILRIDPHGVNEVSPEEVELVNVSSWGNSIPVACHRSVEYANGATPNGDEHNAAYRIVDENLDTTIEKNGFLSGLATVQVRSQVDGLAVVPLNLFPTLRVSAVTTEKGEALDFVQEKKDEDAEFGVVLAKPLQKGELTTLKITYGGKDAVKNEGAGNYYPVARMNWYPNSQQRLGDFVNYHMFFHVAKPMTLVATGSKIGEKTDGKIVTTEWKTDDPLAVVGFNLGEFVSQTETSGNAAHPLKVEAFANREPPEFLSQLADKGPFGSLSTTPMLPQE